MPRDLSLNFTDDKADCHDILGNFLQQLNIHIIGCGVKQLLMVERVEEYILPLFMKGIFQQHAFFSGDAVFRDVWYGRLGADGGMAVGWPMWFWTVSIDGICC